MHTVVHKFEETDLITEGLLFLMCPGASIMRFETSSLVLDFPAHIRTSSMADKLEPAAQSKGLKKVERKM
jgi:hypothetical protein